MQKTDHGFPLLPPHKSPTHEKAGRHNGYCNPLKKMLRWLSIVLLAITVLFCTTHCKSILYGLRQGAGQMEILWNAKPIEDFLNDNNFPDSLKQKLLYIQEVRQYAIDSLGINNSKNYTTLYDQKGKEILWLVVATPPYKLEAYKWKFPILGEFSYKGFFKEKSAQKEAQKLKEQGYDTKIGNVAAWSTLGFFKDPILSGMLNYNEGRLASLIIHELTHSTIFLKNDIQFNENLATFVGEEGAKLFLAHKFGLNSKQYADYIGALNDTKIFTEHLLHGTKQLDDLYLSFPENLTTEEKNKQKNELIQKIVNTTDTLTFYTPNAYSWIRNEEREINNAFFIGYKTYRDDLDVFRQEFHQKFNSNFHEYLKYLKQKYNTSITN